MTYGDRLRRAATLALAVACLFAVPSPAWAHTEIVSTTPAEGVTLDAPPQTISLRFSDAVSTDLAVVAVTYGDREPSRLDVEEVDSATILVRPDRGGEPGRWTVAYRIVSEDGHPIAGTYDFTVKEAAPAPPGDSASNATPPMPSESPSTSPAPEPATTGGTQSAADDQVLTTVVIGLLTLGGVLLTMWLILRAGNKQRS